jgi:hypothetical protein
MDYPENFYNALSRLVDGEVSQEAQDLAVKWAPMIWSQSYKNFFVTDEEAK